MMAIVIVLSCFNVSAVNDFTLGDFESAHTDLEMLTRTNPGQWIEDYEQQETAYSKYEQEKIKERLKRDDFELQLINLLKRIDNGYDSFTMEETNIILDFFGTYNENLTLETLDNILIEKTLFFLHSLYKTMIP